MPSLSLSLSHRRLQSSPAARASSGSPSGSPSTTDKPTTSAPSDSTNTTTTTTTATNGNTSAGGTTNGGAAKSDGSSKSGGANIQLSDLQNILTGLLGKCFEACIVEVKSVFSFAILFSEMNFGTVI